MGNHNTQKIMTSNETHLTVAIADLIISGGLYFNIAQKLRFKKLLDLARNVSKRYQIPNRQLKFNDILDLIHDHNIERNLSFIKKESDNFGSLFLVEDATIFIIPLLKIFVSGKIFQYMYYNLLITRATQQIVGKIWNLYMFQIS